MNRQKKQLLVVAILLIICVIGYFGFDSYYKNKDEKESESLASEKIEAFGMPNYDDINSITYKCDGEKISLIKDKDGNWTNQADSSIDIDEDMVESNMLQCFETIEANNKIENVTDVSQYGFEVAEDGTVTASTNAISFTDADGNNYVLYLGDANPYDSTKYYLMIEGDDNIYLIGSDLQTSFSKSINDITETTTETIVETTETTETIENTISEEE